MFIYKRIVIAQHERGLYLKNRSIRKIIMAVIRMTMVYLIRVWTPPGTV